MTNSVIGSQAGSYIGEIRFQDIVIMLNHVDEMRFHVGKWQQQIVVDTSMVGAFKLGGDSPVLDAL